MLYYDQDSLGTCAHVYIHVTVQICIKCQYTSLHICISETGKTNVEMHINYLNLQPNV